MPAPNSPIDSEKNKRTPHTAKRLAHGTKYFGRPKQRVPHVELQPTATPKC